jgi:hypothetical protein
MPTLRQVRFPPKAVMIRRTAATYSANQAQALDPALKLTSLQRYGPDYLAAADLLASSAPTL